MKDRRLQFGEPLDSDLEAEGFGAAAEHSLRNLRGVLASHGESMHSVKVKRSLTKALTAIQSRHPPRSSALRTEWKDVLDTLGDAKQLTQFMNM